MYASVPDLLRLLAIPAFVYGAYRDVQTRRVTYRLWPPLVAVAVLALAVQAWHAAHAPTGFVLRALVVRTAVSVLVVGGLGAAFYVLPLGFGGADAKALLVLSVLLPTYPTYYLGGAVVPIMPSNVRVFSLSVLTNALILGMAYPLFLVATNALKGEIAGVMAVGKRVPVSELPGIHGRLLKDDDGIHLLGGLDLDAVRMYCRWRGILLADLRDDHELRDPATLPAEPNDPTDGAVDAGPDAGDAGDGAPGVNEGERPATQAAERSESTNGVSGEAASHAADGEAAAPPTDDPWGAAAFLDDIEGTAYGTTPASLRAGLDRLAARDAVWVTPGTPFFVTLALGLVVAFTYGDVLFGALRTLGLA